MISLAYLEDTIPVKIAPGVWKLCDPDNMEATRVIILKGERYESLRIRSNNNHDFISGLDAGKLDECSQSQQPGRAGWRTGKLERICHHDRGHGMSGPTSYRLPNGDLIFPYDTGNTIIPPWVIVERVEKARHHVPGTNEVTKELIPIKELKRFRTEKAARKALKEYAELHGLKPAF